MKIGNHYKDEDGNIFTLVNILPYTRWSKYNICLMMIGTEHLRDNSMFCYWFSEEEFKKEFRLATKEEIEAPIDLKNWIGEDADVFITKCLNKS